MRIRDVVFTLLVALLCAPTALLAQAAPAQAPPPPGTTTAVADEGFDTYATGYYNFNFGGKLFTALQDLDANTNSHGFGAALTLWGRGRFSAEIDFNYNGHFFDAHDRAGTNNLISLTFGGVFGPWLNMGGHQRIRPYVVLAGGVLFSSFDYFSSFNWKTTKTLGCVDAGGGVLYLFHPRVGVRGDVRYRMGVGADESESGWGLLEDWTYWRGSIGIALAF